MNYFPTCTSRLVVQHPCQVSFKSMQGCRRSWEDKLKCVKILSVKGHNSATICGTWIISPHALLDLWYNICTKFHSNPCKDVGGVEKTNFDVTEWRKDGMTDKANTKCPLAILWRGHKRPRHNLHILNDCIYRFHTYYYLFSQGAWIMQFVISYRQLAYQYIYFYIKVNYSNKNITNLLKWCCLTSCHTSRIVYIFFKFKNILLLLIK